MASVRVSGLRLKRMAGGLRQALNYKSKYDDALKLHSINLVPDQPGRLLSENLRPDTLYVILIIN